MSLSDSDFLTPLLKAEQSEVLSLSLVNFITGLLSVSGWPPPRLTSPVIRAVQLNVHLPSLPHVCYHCLARAEPHGPL